MYSGIYYSITPDNDGIFNVQVYSTNFALRMAELMTKVPEWATKMLELATFCSIFAVEKVAFKMTKYFICHFVIFTLIKNAGVKTFMKLTLEVFPWFGKGKQQWNWKSNQDGY